jgi:hypothetical protein
LFWLAARPVNQAAFRGFAPGEVIFRGVSGSRRGTDAEADWEITFKFEASPNVDDVYIGSIGPIAKGGWEYLWVRYQAKEDGPNSDLPHAPIYACVERVYRSGDFSKLGIGS